MDRVADGMIAGLVAAAATAGAMATFGAQLGDPLQSFVPIGALALGAAPRVAAAGVGVVGHVAVSLLWGTIFGLLAPRRRGTPAVALTALLVAALAAGVHTVLLGVLRLGANLGGPRAPLGPVVLLYLLFAAGLAAGLLATRRGAR